jgi:hypothetical protein
MKPWDHPTYPAQELHRLGGVDCGKARPYGHSLPERPTEEQRYAYRCGWMEREREIEERKNARH